jgi:hypothetical protein
VTFLQQKAQVKNATVLLHDPDATDYPLRLSRKGRKWMYCEERLFVAP